MSRIFTAKQGCNLRSIGKVTFILPSNKVQPRATLTRMYANRHDVELLSSNTYHVFDNCCNTVICTEIPREWLLLIKRMGQGSCFGWSAVQTELQSHLALKMMGLQLEYQVDSPKQNYPRGYCSRLGMCQYQSYWKKLNSFHAFAVEPTTRIKKR